MTDEEILRLFERNGMRIELGAQFSARGQIAQLLNGCRELVRKYEADARRYQYLRDNQSWHRYGTLADDDSYAIVGCKFPYLANFECKAMLDYNIDKMLEKKGT